MFTILLLFLTSVAAVGGVAGGGGGGGGGGSAPVTSGGGSAAGGGGGGDVGGSAWINSVTTSEADVYRTSEYNAQWGLETIHAAQAYALLNKNSKTSAGNGVIVGVTDTGIQLDHTELASKNAANSFNNLTAGEIHGTHVATIIAAQKNDAQMHGVAYDASILGVKILGGGGPSGDEYGIAYAAINGAKIVNMSWGFSYGGTNTGVAADINDSTYNLLKGWLSYSMNYGKDHDVLMVAATGNDSYTQYVGMPALFAQDADYASYMIAVTSIDEDLNISWFSNHCKQAKVYCLAAPGGYDLGGLGVYAGIPTNSYTNLVGTSMATPQVTGAAAVLKAAWPALTAPQISHILLSTATQTGYSYDSDKYGMGILNLYAAVQAQGSDTVPAGLNVDSSGLNVSQSLITTDPIFGDAFANNIAPALNSAVFFDDYGRDYKANLAQNISAKSRNSIVYNLNGMMLNNYKTNVIPFTYNFQTESSQINNSKLLQGKIQFNSYSDIRSKYLVIDRSVEDKSLTQGSGFSFVQQNGLENKMGFSFNIDELRNQNFEKFNNAGFISVNGFASNPYQSFVSGAGRVYSDQAQNINAQKNFNQLFFTQKLFEDKFNFTFSNQTSYQNSSILAKAGNKENQISDFNLAYKLNANTNFAASFGNLTEYNSNMLNSQSSGLFSASGDAKTSYVKFSASWNLAKNLYLISSLSEGVTKMNGNDLGIFRNFSNIRSRASSVGLVAENAFGLGGKIGVLYSEPLRVYKGSAQINIPVARDIAGNLQRVNQNISLKPSGRERNIEFFYSRNLAQNSYFNLNFITTKDAGNVKSEKNSYLLMGSYNLKF